MKSDFLTVIFSNEFKATLDGTDCVSIGRMGHRLELRINIYQPIFWIEI